MATKKNSISIRWQDCYYSSGQCYESEDTPTEGGKRKYRARLSFKEGGKWHGKTKTIWATGKRDAQNQLTSWQAKEEKAHADAIAEAGKPKRIELTVGEYVQQFIESREAMRIVEPTTIAFYRKQAKHVLAGFPKMKLSDLTPEDVNAWTVSLMDGGLSPTSAAKAVKFLKSITKQARIDGRLETDPLQYLRPPKANKQNPNALDAKGRARLVSFLEIAPASATNTGIAIALYTGMRIGEICGLQWRHVDVNGAILTVRQSVGDANGKTYLKEPKTTQSRRTIPLPKQLVSILAQRFEEQQKECAEAGVPFTENLFVIGTLNDGTGDYARPNTVSRKWGAVADALDLVGTEGRKPCFHDLRHTFATAAIANGMDVKSVSSILGHANAAMTLNVYASADPDAMRRTVDAVADAISAPIPPQIIAFKAAGHGIAG